MTVPLRERWEGQPVAEQRRLALSEIRTAIENGQVPTSVFSADDLEWASGGGQKAQVDALIEEGQRRGEEAEARRDRAERLRQLKPTTKAILAEWDAEERAERWRKAQAEAWKRLGLTEGASDA